nr:hypothetical protein [Tanacetum cinerariifolium]
MQNEIMAVGSKERPPMLAPAPADEDTLTHDIITEKETYENTTAEKRVVIDVEQGESINIHDVKPKLFWDFGKFTSRDEESIESYYTRPDVATKSKGKEIVKAPSPPPESESEEECDEEQAQRDKHI